MHYLIWISMYICSSRSMDLLRGGECAALCTHAPAGGYRRHMTGVLQPWASPSSSPTSVTRIGPCIRMWTKLLNTVSNDPGTTCFWFPVMLLRTPNTAVLRSSVRVESVACEMLFFSVRNTSIYLQQNGRRTFNTRATKALVLCKLVKHRPSLWTTTEAAGKTVDPPPPRSRKVFHNMPT